MALNELRLRTFRETSERALDDGVASALHDLSNALIVSSELMHRLQKRVPEGHDLNASVRAIDAAFTDSIAFTRKLSQGIHARRRSDQYVSVTRMVDELATLLAPCLPDGIAISVKCCESLAIVGASRAQLARMLVALCEGAILGMTKGGLLAVAVSEEIGADEATAKREILIEVSGGGDAFETSSAVQTHVRSVGGGLEIRNRPRRSAAMVRIPAAC